MSRLTFALSAFLICLVATPAVRALARRNNWMAHPVAERWHSKSTALMGGIAIYLGLSLPLLWQADFGSVLRSAIGGTDVIPLPSLPATILLGASGLFILGLIDDFIGVKPYTKLVGQILVASLVTFLGFRLQWFGSLTLDTMVTMIWIVGVTNAFNLIDNMDGLCAGVGMVAAIGLAVIFWPTAPAAAIAALCLAGSLLAFLIFNFNPASIFMGDCGSLVIGYTISVLALFYAGLQTENRLAGYAVPVMIVMVPILDTSMVTIIRLLSGRKASTGGKDHASHRLVLTGLSEKNAVLILMGIGAISGIGAVYVHRYDSLTAPAVIIPLGLAILLMGIFLSQLRVYPEKEFSLLRDKTFTPVLVELTYKRQLLLVILDFGLVAFAYYLSYRLRFSGPDFSYCFQIFLKSLPAVIVCKLLAFFLSGVYRNIFGYMSTDEVLAHIKASTFGTLLSVAVVTYAYRFEDFSKGIFLIDWLLVNFALLGTRGFFRLGGDLMKRKTLQGEKVLIYGAGRGGEILLREILNNPRLKIKPVGFIDDDPLKIGKKLQGYAVMGGFKDLDALLARQPVDGLLISFRDKDARAHAEIENFCRAKGLSLRQFKISIEQMDLSG